jgi:hypothetical protein
MAGRQQNSIADAGARRSNRLWSNGFQEILLDHRVHEMRKATSRICGVVAWMMLNFRVRSIRLQFPQARCDG